MHILCPQVKSIYTVSKCKKLIPGWTLPGFKEDALQLYQEVCRQLAEGDRTELRHVSASACIG